MLLLLARDDGRFAPQVAQVALREHGQLLFVEPILDFLPRGHARAARFTRADDDGVGDFADDLHRGGPARLQIADALADRRGKVGLGGRAEVDRLRAFDAGDLAFDRGAAVDAALEALQQLAARRGRGHLAQRDARGRARRLAFTLFPQRDDVDAVLGADRQRDLARVQPLHHVGHFRRQFAGGDPADVAARGG